MKITKIAINNFKNLKNFVIYPNKFNVIVGPNNSGKSNFIEFFKLIKKILRGDLYPFLEWDGYHNIAWKKKKIPIEFELELTEQGKLSDILSNYDEITNENLSKFVKTNLENEITIIRRYKIEFTESAEKVKILYEKFETEVPELNYFLSVEKSGEELKEKEGNNCIKASIEEDYVISREIVRFWEEHIKTNLDLSELYYWIVFDHFDENFEKKASINDFYLLEYLENSMLLYPIIFLYNSCCLFNLDIKHKPKIFPVEEEIKERGENILDVLAQMQFKTGRMPENIEFMTNKYFNGKIYFKGEAPGKLNLYLWDNELKIEISKENFPDGLIKALTILTVLELKPSILFIDEIENSLHPELLESMIKELKNFEGYVFITTHNPYVLDLVNPEEIIIFKREEEKVKTKKVTDYKNKDELLKELEELGISLGEKNISQDDVI